MDYDAVKRAVDFTAAMAGSVLLAPVIGALAVLVRKRLGSPVLFRQQRPGLRGRSFELLKFRTMTDARDEEGNLLPDEQRLTAFGQALRSTSLDELPELWNVLRGDMSLVGPRPLLMEYLPRYTSRQARRHEVRPGITGWAQVNGRNAPDWVERLEMDVWYVEHRSFLLDLRILGRTVLAVLRRDGISTEGHVTAPKFRGTDGC
jgi:lipopolysaccharide/colanic/teichoic acid biosynthesis glycosyltransferase